MEKTMATGERLTRKQVEAREREDAADRLRELVKPGGTVFTILRHVSRSGMLRHITLHIMGAEKDGTLDITHLAAKAMGEKRADNGGIKMGGCGMDMGFSLVYSLSTILYGNGYKCAGRGESWSGKCPSCYHSNYRPTIRCNGEETTDGNRSQCWAPSGWSQMIPDTWPRFEKTIKGKALKGSPKACITNELGENPRPCKACNGVGNFPNPEGPERFDLIHKDGNALRQRWL